MFAHGLTILIGLLAVIGEIGLGLDGSSSKFHFNKISDFDDIVEKEREKTQIDPSLNHRDIQSRSPGAEGWNSMSGKSQNEKDKNSGRFIFEQPIQYIAESNGDESGYYHVEPRRAESDTRKTFNCSKDSSPQVEHFACEHASVGETTTYTEPSSELTEAQSNPKPSEQGDICSAINQLLKNPIVERLLMNTMYKSPKPAEKWNTFVFIVRKMEPNTPEGLLEHPNAKECVKRYVRKKRRKRHSTATLLRRKQKVIKRLQRRDTWEKMKEADLFKDIANFLVSNKLKHKGYTYVPVMFSHQGNDGLAGFNARDLNDFSQKLTDSTLTSKSTSATTPSSTAATAALWTTSSSTDLNEFSFKLPNQITDMGIEGEKMATESVAIHAGGSMVPGILIYPVGKKLKRFPLDKTELDNVVNEALHGVGNMLYQTTKSSFEFIPTYTMPVLKRGIPPECAEDTEKLLQLLAAAKDKESPPRRMIPGILVYPLSKIKRFVSGSTNVADSSTTTDAQPTFYALDRNVLRAKAQKILKKEVPPECLKDTDQLLNLLANAIDENLTSTTTDAGSPDSTQGSAEPENTTTEQEGSTAVDQSTSSEQIDLKSLGINIDGEGALPGGDALLGGAAPLGGETLLGEGVGSVNGEASGDFGLPPSDSCETTQCNLETTTENNCECAEATENSEDLFTTENMFNNLGPMGGGGGGEAQPGLMEGGPAAFSLMSNDQALPDTSLTSLNESSTEARSTAMASSAGSSGTAQETECVTVTPVTTACDSSSKTEPGSNKDDRVKKDMTQERLKRLEKDLKLVNEVESILKRTGQKHKIRKRDLTSILDETSIEENQTPTIQIDITVKTENTESADMLYDQPTKTAREINQQMLRGLGKLLKWKNSHNSHNPSRPKRSRTSRAKRKRRRKKKRRHRPLEEFRNRDHFIRERMGKKNRFLVKRHQNFMWGGKNYIENQ